MAASCYSKSQYQTWEQLMAGFGLVPLGKATEKKKKKTKIMHVSNTEQLSGMRVRESR